MARLDQLEIIEPDGTISFHDLDPAQGVTNIGRDAENDIVIAGAEVAPFLAMIDHRERPYQLLILDVGGRVLLDGEQVPPNLGRDLHGWSTIEINGYSMVLVEHSENGTAAAPLRAAASAAGAGLALTAAAARSMTPGGGAAAPATRLSVPPADRVDDVIVAELLSREKTIECGQAATFPLTVINGGSIVATFDIAVDGLDPAWVEIQPATLNLNEGERDGVTLVVTPPRTPASRAGAHHFSVIITSPNHPDRATRLGATVTIEPFYDFTLGDLAPYQNFASWKKRTAEATVTLINKSNADAVYRVEGDDNQRGCAFEYQMPGNGTGRSARQTEVRLPPDTGVDLKVFITPMKRRTFGARYHTYSLTVTASPLNGQQTPKSVRGELQASPRFGWLAILLMLATSLFMCSVLTYIVFHPYINSFAPGGPADIKGGESVALNWSTSPFVNLKLLQEVATGDGATSVQEVGSLAAPNGTFSVRPFQTARYRLVASNLLSDLLSFLTVQSEWVVVNVEPVPPIIEVFDTLPEERKTIVLGESANLVWRVFGAEKVMLIGTDGLLQSLSPTDTGSLNVSPIGRTSYTLNAANAYGTAEPRQVVLAVFTPTPTPVPKPVILQFDVQPRVITAGQSINVSWEVQGASRVEIRGIAGADNYPPRGSLQQSPTTDTNYQLLAYSGPAGAEETVSVGPFVVKVNAAPPPPSSPKIEFFQSVRASIVRGLQQTELQWVVTGATTNIKITGPDIGEVPNLPASGSLQVAPQNTSLYVMTALNGAAPPSVSTTQVQVVDPPTPTPTATPMPTPSPTPPAPSIESFKARCMAAVCGLETAPVTESNTTAYKVWAGQRVYLTWITHNALNVVTLTSPSGTIDLSNVDGTTSPDPAYLTDELIAGSSVVYQLTARNANGVLARYQMIFQLIPRPAPAPFNVNGVYTPGSPATITWNYSGTDLPLVTKFRLYRFVKDSPTPETRIDVTAVEAACSADQVSACQIMDNTANPTCNKEYYIVALYQDIGGITESAPSNSWWTGPCP